MVEDLSKYDVIPTGLRGKKAYEILCSVEGQMSDGMWENSSMMEGYWMFSDIHKIHDEVVICIKKSWGELKWGGTHYKNNLFKLKNMSDNDIRNFFANKIKQIIKQEEKDGWEDHPITWKRDCTVVSKYMGYDEEITVQDAYQVYDILKGR